MASLALSKEETLMKHDSLKLENVLFLALLPLLFFQEGFLGDFLVSLNATKCVLAVQSWILSAVSLKIWAYCLHQCESG